MVELSGPLAARDLRPARVQIGHAAVLGGLLAGGLTLALYGATGARGVAWQDPGFHQYRIITGQLENPAGLALSHPLHYWLGRAAITVPLGDPVFKLNLLSSLCGAIGVGVLTGLLIRLTRNPLAGAVGAVTLALSHSYWQMSALAETYPLAAALMIIEWALLLRYVRTRRPIWLVAVFAVNGLHVADHLLGLLTLATYGVLLLERIARRRIELKWLPIAILAWIITALPYEMLVISHYLRTHDLPGTLQTALFGGGERNRSWAREVLNVSLSAGQLKLVLLTFGYCLPSAAGLLALVGILRPMRGRRRILRRVLIAQTVIIFFFVGRYAIKDLYTFFVPVCTLTALWCGWGVHGLWRRWRGGRQRRWLMAALAVNALLPLMVYSVFPRVAQHRGWMRDRMRDIPYRDEYASFFQPWRCTDHSAAEMARDILARAGPGGWVLADSTTAPAVAVTYLVHGGPPGMRVYWDRMCLTKPERPNLTDDELRAHLESRGAVLAVPSPDVRAIVREPLRIEDEGPFWRITLGVTDATLSRPTRPWHPAGAGTRSAGPPSPALFDRLQAGPTRPRWTRRSSATVRERTVNEATSPW